MAVQNPTEKTTDTYNAIAEDYAARWHTTILADELDRFLSYLKPGGLLLDIGCGTGRDVLEFSRRGFRVVGIDRSAAMLKFAAQAGVRSLVLADSRRQPFAQNVFDGEWACASLLHLPKADFPQALHEINRTLRHGHVYLSLKKGEGETWLNDYDHRRFYAFYHPAEVELALERTGFHVLDVWLSGDAIGRDTRWISVIGWTRLDTPKVGGCAIIFDEQGRVLLTRRADNGLWCVPGGHMDMDETIENTAIREVKEETGLNVAIEALSGMYTVHYPAEMFPEKKPRAVFIVAFRCSILGGELTLNEEVTEFGWFNPQHLPDDIIPQHKIRISDAVAQI